ncbi:hypothetical protein B9T36_07060 [Acinetobacter sp. ANC 4204]|uniref:DUF7940 domain-containing protein n=1 Tax=Acinetobacter sp. ANC 4204 TaxID=1977884 RepID=UPI000A3489E3|nr:hypothetical protein [Acinetobacter sp. ANC 4204]OTG60373.1 hypothetical protein B9T36_07060 [Acinetobacter sp. ANC 4204]
MKPVIKNNLVQLAKVERHIARFQKLSKIHERTLTERNDQLDYTWKNGYEAGARAASEAVNRQAIDNKITLTADASALVKSLNQSQQELAELIGVDTASESEKIQQLRLQLSTRESELDQKTLELSEAKKKLLDQAKRHQQRVDELKVEIAQKPEPIFAELGSFTNTGFVVGNWRNSWKWISNWCFGLIVFFATTPIPPELLMVLPEDIRTYLIAWTALCGLVGRYINQTKPVSLPPIGIGDADV